MKEWGNHLFTGKIWVRDDSPFIHVAPTWEIEEPFRFSAKTLHIKRNKNQARVIGLWHVTDKPISIHLLEALRGKVIETTIEKIREDFRPQERDGSIEDSSDMEHAGIQQGSTQDQELQHS